MTEATQDFHDARNPMLLSYSGIALYLTCRHKWRLQNVYGLRPVIRSRPLDIGSAVHKALEFVLSERGTLQDGIDAWTDAALAAVPLDMEPGPENEIRTYAAEALTIATRVVREIQARGLVTYRDSKGPVVERELMVPITKWDGFAFHIDWVALDPQDNSLWIVDFKTRKTFYDAGTEDVNLQNALYQYGASRVFARPIAGTLTFQVRSTVPSRPKINKDGKVSRAKITTDWETYLSVIQEAGEDPTDYEDMRSALSTVEWTSVLKAYRSWDHVLNIWDTIARPLAYEMGSVRDDLLSDSAQYRSIGAVRAPRNLSPRTCNGCAVRDVCLNALRGWETLSLVQGMNPRDGSAERAIADGNL